MNVSPTKSDMQLTSKIFPHVSEEPAVRYEDIPLRWTLNGEVICGIPERFERTYRKELTDANITRRTYTGRCTKCGLTVEAVCLEYRDFPVNEWTVFFTNNGTGDSPLISDVMIGGEIKGRFSAFIHGNGDNCNPSGYEWFRDSLEDGEMTIHPNDGTSCNGAFPYMKLEYENFVVRAAVGWSARWKASVRRTEEGAAYYAGQLRFNMKLHPGETMRTPRMTFMITEGDDSRSINMWRRWYIAHILPRENGKPIEPAMCLHYWSCEGKPEHTAATEENQVSAIREYVSRGLTPDIWWIDAGWYKCDYNWPKTGTWKPDPERFPNGLGPIGRECEKYGTRFLLWFEPERVTEDSELETEHKEWLLPTGYDGDTNSLLNLGNREACDWLIGRIDSIIKEGRIKVYRQDFNFNPAPCWDRAEEADRLGAIENLHVQGYLRYWDALIERNPGLWIDSCASGGRRNDLETMRRAVPLHYTDVGYGNHEIKQKQFRELHEWIPYFRSHNMSWDREYVENELRTEWKENDEFSFQNAMVPAVTYMTWYNAPDEEYERTKKAEKIWRRAARLTLSGDYYPLTETKKDTSDWYAVQFEDSDAGQGFVQFIRNIKAENEEFTVYPHVEEGRTYRFDYPDGIREYSSETIKKNGLTMKLPVRSGVVVFYEII